MSREERELDAIRREYLAIAGDYGVRQRRGALRLRAKELAAAASAKRAARRKRGDG